MWKIKSKKLSIVLDFFKKQLRVLAEHPFLASLALILVALIFGGFVFYKYSFLVEKKGAEILEKPLFFDEATFREILKIWQERQKKFEEAESKEYPNPFSPPSL